MTLYQWFAKNGDKVLSLLTVLSGALALDSASLGLNPTAMAWVTLGGTIATAAHTIFFPNAAMPPNK